MEHLEWAHALAAIAGALFGAVGAIFTGGWRLGRIESRIETSMQKSISESEQRLEDKLQSVTQPFDETLKGLRQKINDVELDTERRFLQKGEFDDFRKEYREDMRELKSMVAKN